MLLGWSVKYYAVLFWLTYKLGVGRIWGFIFINRLHLMAQKYPATSGKLLLRVCRFFCSM